MTRGTPKKLQRADQRHQRAAVAAALLLGGKVPPKAIPVAPQRSRPSVGLATGVLEPLVPHHYPTKRAQIGKPQTAGGR